MTKLTYRVVLLYYKLHRLKITLLCLMFAPVFDYFVILFLKEVTNRDFRNWSVVLGS